MFLVVLNANLTPALHESVHYILTTPPVYVTHPN